MATATDSAATGRALGAWLTEILNRPIEVADLSSPEGAGFSAQTLLFDAVDTGEGVENRHGMVVRIAPEGPGLFPSYDIPGEAKVLSALGTHTDVPVPEIVGVEPDPAVLGAPFLVMRRIPGRVPLDNPPWTVSGWVVDLPPDGRERVFDEFIRVLAAIHRVDWKGLGLDFLDRPVDGDTPLDQHLTHLDRFYDFASEGRRGHPTIDAGLRWIVEQRPATVEPTVLSWGDSQPHNMIYADDLTAVGALDWEMMDLASPEMDLACLTFAMRLYSDGMGVQMADGFPDRDRIIAKYERASGHSVRHLDYYEVFNAVRASIVLMRLGYLLISAGALPPDATMPIANPASIVLARLLGTPEPGSGSTGSLFS